MYLYASDKNTNHQWPTCDMLVTGLVTRQESEVVQPAHWPPIKCFQESVVLALFHQQLVMGTQGFQEPLREASTNVSYPYNA